MVALKIGISVREVFYTADRDSTYKTRLVISCLIPGSIKTNAATFRCTKRLHSNDHAGTSMLANRRFEVTAVDHVSAHSHHYYSKPIVRQFLKTQYE